MNEIENTANNKTFKSATVAIVGRPNAGKSTLLNALMENDFSATSDRPQTTRKNIKGIMQLEDDKGDWCGQLVFVDTPGINFQRGLLERSMHNSVEGAFYDVDVLVWVADARKFASDLNDIELDRLSDDRVPQWMKSQMSKLGDNSRWILLLSKCDLVPKGKLLPLIEKAHKILPEFEEIIPISAIKGLNKKDSNLYALVESLKEKAALRAPEYSQDDWTDLTQRELLRNLIRECIFRQTKKEVPYLSDCSILQFIDGQNGRKPEVDAIVWVSRDSIKKIMVGSKGSRIKEIGTSARKRFEEVTGQEIILRLKVKVVDKWERKSAMIEDLGYVTA